MLFQMSFDCCQLLRCYTLLRSDGFFLSKAFNDNRQINNRIDLIISLYIIFAHRSDYDELLERICSNFFVEWNFKRNIEIKSFIVCDVRVMWLSFQNGFRFI